MRLSIGWWSKLLLLPPRVVAVKLPVPEPFAMAEADSRVGERRGVVLLPPRLLLRSGGTFVTDEQEVVFVLVGLLPVEVNTEASDVPRPGAVVSFNSGQSPAGDGTGSKDGELIPSSLS